MTLLLHAAVNGLILGLVYALVALGLSFIWGVMDVVNLAHAEYLMLSLYATYWLWALGRIEPALAVPVVVPAFFLAGWLTYRLLIQHILRAPLATQIFATFGLLFFLRYSAFAAFGPDVRGFLEAAAPPSVPVLGVPIAVPKLVAAAGALAAFAALALFLRRTKTGRALQAAAQNRDVALALGIPVERMYALAWGIAIASVALAGVLLFPFSQVSPTIGDAFLLVAFASVVLGGFGRVDGALVGGVTIGLVENVLGTLLAPSFKLLFVFVAFVLILLVRPHGLIGEPA
ncbi:MAG: branched-chain amino acid ABC transporter permease [Armatimonadota bacterium]|nr:branched-chain amino acid ABC transporter permease [Armatimonadota bacterium]MDR7486938.1 branched-chain amino acid ABC transporter permease [Armatimonadota bacterium]MDR7533529.1 branched-chain amino acid ABC transporter permease [Armatimonadota bacterium]MDR7536881.1 branched-chain amino acid ABC transporter permease [Armatimonadota bacterium]